MTRTYPWEYHSDLTAERLVAVAEMIIDGRHTALDLHDESAGDNGWTLGCRAFQFARHRILNAIDSGSHPWLTAIDRSLQLIFKVGEVPVRIYKGDADDPSDRTLRQTFGELNQLGLLFPEHDEARDLAYRFAIETDVDGSVSGVKFVGLRGETAVLCWDAPCSREVVGIEPSDQSREDEGVELPAPAVGVRGADEGRGTSAA